MLCFAYLKFSPLLIILSRLDAMEKLPDAALYDSFAYHTALLTDFSRGDYIGNAASLSASLGRQRRRGLGGGGGRCC